MGAGDPDSGPHACPESTLRAEHLLTLVSPSLAASLASVHLIPYKWVPRLIREGT